ncbi:TetR family transcriptional regulator [bacterium]|nr:TetR family transcriptional regulator [bacterium]
MAEGATKPQNRLARVPLSAQRIIEAALTMIDRDGLEAFSFRGLAAGLGCQAMSLYHYFPSRAHLLEALVELMIAEASDFPDSGPWQDRLRGACDAFRQSALSHAGLFCYFSLFRLNNASGMALLERYFNILGAAGLGPEAQARQVHILRSYLTGACLAETARGTGSATPVPFAEARRDYPDMMAAAAFAGAEGRRARFDAGIAVLIRGIEAELNL